MGWFWASGSPAPTTAATPSQPAHLTDVNPPPGCPMHRPPQASQTRSPLAKSSSPSGPACPSVPPAATTPSASQRPSPASTIAALNPLNYMPSDLSQSRESAAQTTALSIDRETSSIPRGGEEPTSTSGNWVYPSPQQMYNAMLRKGYTDTPEDAVESMVAIHNFLNEGAWAEIVEWERRFGKGLAQGWKECQFGEEGSMSGAMILPNPNEDQSRQPKLVRFMGRSDSITPKARMLQVLGWMHPARFGGPPPFDRHDWYVERRYGKDQRPVEVRYVIDYYSAPPEPTGEPVFYLDIRPALDRPSAAAERLVRWGRDLWWRGSGASERLRPQP